jgi:predicted esterase
MFGSPARAIATLSLLVGATACRNGAESAAPPAPHVATRAAEASSGTASTTTASAPFAEEEADSGRAREPAPSPKPARWPLHDAPGVATDWCIEGVDALDEETCYVLPAEPTTTVLVYLHGIVPPEKTSAQKTNFETAVKNATRRGGVAALMPRGKQGFTSRDHGRWWGWPTGGSAYQRHAANLVAGILEKQQRLEKLAGVRFERRYVAGSSAGAYFAAALALRGGIAADGFGAMSGGAGGRTFELAQLSPKPFYIGYGTQDSVGASARALADVLRGAGWPVRISAHPVGHGAKEIYIDEALKFFRESAR